MSADLELAERAARTAGEVLLSYYGRPPEGLASKSSETDLVSDADLEAERAIRELLEKERPDDGLLAEEGSQATGAAAGVGSSTHSMGPSTSSTAFQPGR